jgi:hypothetical protein
MTNKIPYYAPTFKETKASNYPGAKTSQEPTNEWDNFYIMEASSKVSSYPYVIGLKEKLPGIATVSVEIEYLFTVTTIENSSVQSTKRVGLGLRTINISLLITNEKELNKFNEIMSKTAMVNAGYEASFYRVSHPQCSLWGIQYAYFKSISSPAPNAVDGWTVTIKMQEYSAEPVKRKKDKTKDKTKSRDATPDPETK